MKIVYLDAHTLNPGDLDWVPIQSLGDVTFYDRTSPDAQKTPKSYWSMKLN